MTRLRIGLGLGFAAGYYLGAKAGRQRYEQINRTIARLRKSRPVRRVRAGIELGRERIRSRGNDEPAQLVLVDERGTAAQGSSR